MNKKTIYFIRHGQTDQNKLRIIQGRKNFPLNETGIKEAIITANYLKEHNISFDKIYSSPLDRAYLTAQIISKITSNNIKVIKDSSFIERDFGSAEGLDITKQNFLGVINERYPGLEKDIDIKKRTYNGLLNIINNTDANNILIVAHSHTIKGFIRNIDEDYSYYGKLSNCAICIFEYDNKFTIKKLNIDPNKKSL